SADLRLIGNVADRARLRSGAEEGSLRTAQDLDAVQVEEVDVRREERERDHRLIEVNAHLLLHTRLIADDLAGGNAADGDLALPRAEVLDREAGDVRRDVLECLGAAVAEL